jgi:hypothetical protein
MDSLRIDVIGTTADEIDLDAIVRRLLQRLRLVTRQWWITRINGGRRNYERNQFPIDKNGAALSRSAEARQHVRIPFGFESGINDAIWTSCVEEAVRGVETAIAEMSVLDAFYFVAEDDQRNAIMYGCWALEQVVEAEFARLWPRHGHRQTFRRGVLTGHDATTHIDVDARKYFGRSFADEFPKNFEKLSLLWRARNVVAHGGSGGAYRAIITMGTEELEKVIRAVKVAVRWLQNA